MTDSKRARVEEYERLKVEYMEATLNANDVVDLEDFSGEAEAAERALDAFVAALLGEPERGGSDNVVAFDHGRCMACGREGERLWAANCAHGCEPEREPDEIAEWLNRFQGAWGVRAMWTEADVQHLLKYIGRPPSTSASEPPCACGHQRSLHAFHGEGDPQDCHHTSCDCTDYRPAHASEGDEASEAIEELEVMLASPTLHAQSEHAGRKALAVLRRLAARQPTSTPEDSDE